MISVVLAQVTDTAIAGGVAGGIVGGIYMAAKTLEWFNPTIRGKLNGKCGYTDGDRAATVKAAKLADRNNRAIDRIIEVCTERDADRVPLCYVPRRWEGILTDIRDELRKLNRGPT